MTFNIWDLWDYRIAVIDEDWMPEHNTLIIQPQPAHTNKSLKYENKFSWLTFLGISYPPNFISSPLQWLVHGNTRDTRRISFTTCWV